MIWFDEASVRLNNTIFERRYDFLLQHLPTDCPINVSFFSILFIFFI